MALDLQQSRRPRLHPRGYRGTARTIASTLYWCMCDEIGSEGTYHTHLYIAFQNPKLHTVLANAFPNAHRDIVKGTSQQNRDYVLKDGEKFNKQSDGTYDYIDTSGKRHQGTNYSDTFLEWGEMPREQQGKSKDAERIYNLLKDGASNLEIVDTVPSAILAPCSRDNALTIYSLNPHGKRASPSLPPCLTCSHDIFIGKYFTFFLTFHTKFSTRNNCTYTHNVLAYTNKKQGRSQ